MSNIKSDSQNKVGRSFTYRKKLKKYENYFLYKGRVEQRIDLLQKKIDNDNKKIKDINLNIKNDNILYKKYERELLSLERSMNEMFSLYGIKRSDYQIMNYSDNSDDSNELFSKICEKYNSMEKIKMYMHNLELTIKDSFNNREKLNKHTQKLKKRISLLEYYLHYLYSVYDYMKLYTKSNNTKKKVRK